MASRRSSPANESFIIHDDSETLDRREEWIPADKGAFRIRYVHDDSVLSYDPEDDEEEQEEDDPFDSSELSEHDASFNSMTTNSDGQQLQQQDRNFSTATAIPDGYLSRFQVVGQSIEPPGQDENIDDSFTSGELNKEQHEDSLAEARKPSDTFSAFPEEMQYYRSSLPGSELRSPLGRSKSQNLTLSNPGSPRLSQQQPLLLAQEVHSFSHSNSATYRKGDDRPVFRNPSSVREMQMSSPPPFAGPSPPRSARHRRNQTAVFSPSSPSLSSSLQGSPLRQNTPSRQQSHGYEKLHGAYQGSPIGKHPDPRKEYPLILLHCTLAPLPMFSHYSSQQLASVLPLDKQRDLAALSEKLGPTIMERGILLTHPGDDYDLLEERILESLELETPRLGSCGHHRSGVDNQDLPSPAALANHVCDLFGSKEEDQCHSECSNKCPDCGKHISLKLIGGERRWDVRIYAANGLMRAGVWSAAWKEMERVDVEIGISLGEGMRKALDDCRAKEASETIIMGRTTQSTLDAMSTSVSADEVEAMDNAASIAELSRRPSSASTSTQRAKRNPRSFDVPKREDLTTLLLKFIARNLEQNRDRLFLGLLICLGLWSAVAMATVGKEAQSVTGFQVSDSITAQLTAMQVENEELKGLLSQATGSAAELSPSPSTAIFGSAATFTVTHTTTATIVENAMASSILSCDDLPSDYANVALKALSGRTVENCDLSCFCQIPHAVDSTGVELEANSGVTEVEVI